MKPYSNHPTKDSLVYSKSWNGIGTLGQPLASAETVPPVGSAAMSFEEEMLGTNPLAISSLPLHSVVRQALEDHPTTVGPLDATDILTILNDHEQCLFFAQYPSLQSLILRSWSYLSLGVLRCISITSGDHLEELDFCSAHIQASHLQVILVRSEQLRVLRLTASQADVQCAKIIVQLSCHSLEELYLDRCNKITSNALEWLGGCTGGVTRGLYKLRYLDLGETPIKDKGLQAIAHGCCSLLTNKSVMAMGKNWKYLQSLNLSRCPLITDKGIKAIACGCKSLQAVNLAGLVKVSEERCERITMNGLENLIKGLQYVEAAVTFLGFKPVDEHVERKLAYALRMVRTRQSQLDEADRLARLKAAEEERLHRLHIANGAARLIQGYLYRFKCRMNFYQMWRRRVERNAVQLLQRVYRGYKGRLQGNLRRHEVAEFHAKSPYAMKIQKTVRAFLCRLKNDHVSKKIRELYIMRRKEVYTALAVRLQAQGRRYLDMKKVKAWQEIRQRYRINIHDAALLIQKLAPFVLDRHYVERRDAIVAARKRFAQFALDNKQDSASEPDDDDWHELDEYNAWVKEFDAQKKRVYWQNHLTQEISYDEPHRPFATELGLIGKRIRVYWVVQAAWYEGSITRYHKRKNRHRVEYDDGDHEWINCDQECERVQIQAADGAWVMYQMYQTEDKIDEIRKAQDKAKTEEYKEQAFRDAMQWKSFTDDETKDVMFLSQLTGELRTGAPFALDWIVQDDGYGFPCFVNSVTGAVAYEDPRFTYDVSEDLQQQRRYVMQELRYAIYVCKALWEEYEEVVELGDPHQMNRIYSKIRNSVKTIHLDAFLIRAQALYKPTSIVDRPMDKAVHEELEYAAWLAARLAEARDKAEQVLRERHDKKLSIVDKLTEKSGQRVYCVHCGRETQRHLAFCLTCGKAQLIFDTEPKQKGGGGTAGMNNEKKVSFPGIVEEEESSKVSQEPT
eukprot:scaffold974_cov176-Ochromonas_danica.AAC.3